MTPLPEGAGPEFTRCIEASDAQLLGPDLGRGLEFAAERSRIYTERIGAWAEEERRGFGYDRPFAVVALGGTGREEMTPCSDTDFAFLFDDAIEENPFLLELQRQVIHTGEFHERSGFQPGALPFNLEDMPELDTVQRNSFLDMKPVYDPEGLTQRFRDRIRATFDPFEHFLHVSSIWREHSGQLKARSERLDEFDIKRDGLRVFLAGIWTLAARDFVHSHEVYRSLDDRRDLEAYGFLLRIRAFVHLQRGTRSAPSAAGYHREDVLGFDDFCSFGAMLGADAGERERFEFENEVRARLLAARRRVDRFTRGVIGRALKEGREIRPGSAIIYGAGGLWDTAAPNRESDYEKSRAALAVVLASQRYGLPIDSSELETTFRDAGDWLVPVPELSALFYEPQGSLADSFKFLSQLDGAEEQLFPGYQKYEASLDERVLAERTTLRGAHEREKLRALEEFCREGAQMLEHARQPSSLADPAHEVSVPVEAALLDPNQLAAVKLALKTKRLPETVDDLKTRSDESLPMHDRFSSGLSGIPLEDYYANCFRDAGFTDETLELAQFLVQNRRAFKVWAHADLVSADLVQDFVELCGTEARTRALFVFTCADRVGWEGEKSDPSRWFNSHELFCKAKMVFHPDSDPTAPLASAGYSPDELDILKDFGSDFFEGVYRHYAIRFGVHLIRMVGQSTEPRPRVSLIRRGASTILGIAARDHPGMAACISGALWKRGMELHQAHLFSATNHGLALDFFHIDPGEAKLEPEVTKELEEEIQSQKYIGADDEDDLPAVAENISLVQWQRGLYCLRAETSGDVGALVYELTWKVFRLFGANIFGLAAHAGHDHAYVSVYHNLPGRSDEEAREIIREGFRVPDEAPL